MQRLRSVTAALVGRWQVPLAICAILVGALALHQMKPPKQTVPFDSLLADVWVLVEAGALFDAANATANLLELDPPLPVDQRATLHDALAEITYLQELQRGLPNRKNTQLLLEHQQAALACGHRLDTRAALRTGQAQEWLGQTKRAISAYRTVLEREPGAEARRTALQGLVRLLEGQAEYAEERRQHIKALLAEEGVSPSYLWWALQHAVQEAIDFGDDERARRLLTDHGQRFTRSDLKGYYDYLWAWVYVREGRTKLAAPLLDQVDQWLAEHATADAEMDKAGFLPALSRWLRGRIELAEGRPQTALDLFDQAFALQSHGDLLVSTTIGRSLALGLLERHEAARKVIRDTVARLESDPTTLSVGRPRLRDAIKQLLDQRQLVQDYENAIAYLAVALELTPEGETGLQLDLLEQLGHQSAQAAQVAGDGQDPRQLHANAARCYEQAADLAYLDEPRHASLLWASAAQFDFAGRVADARRLLLRFVSGRSLDPRMPQALLQLGHAYAAAGELDEAIKHYEQLITKYPRLEETSRARLLTAGCLMALGEERYAEAGSILESLLEDEDIAPSARVFRDALFELCDLRYQQERWASAISRMEDFLAFFPEDAERYRIRFMLADAYRRSAHALLEDQTAATDAARLRVGRERFRRAADLFAAFLDDMAAMGPTQDRAQGSYERLALLYRGDCLYELEQPTSLAEALATYRQAAARYQNEPAALAAQMQIANVYLRQGKLTEAARAVERARWLLRSIPDQAFDEYDDGMDRAAWDRYLSAVRSTHLFQDVLAKTP
jgi:tetratricopeptide (TPR) repeat protein